MIRNFTNDDYENKIEVVLSDILHDSSDLLKSLFKLFALLDSPLKAADLQKNYTVGNRKVTIINNSEELEIAINSMKLIPFISFDSEQKPLFKKNQKSHGISLVQLANETVCYLIQVKQIDNISPLLRLLENEKIVKVGIGLDGDKKELYNQFNIKLKSTIDLVQVLKQLSSYDSIGAKRSASMFLDQNLQKSKNMSRSNWENEQLTDGQIKYASEDATVVYDVLIQMIKDYPFVLEFMPKLSK
jgi:ribonuclease D